MPPFTVASLATTMTSRPRTRPMPVTRPGRGRRPVVQPVRGQGPDLQERRAGVEQPLHALAGEELALLALAAHRLLPAARAGFGEPPLQVRLEPLHVRQVLAELRASGLDVRSR